MLSDTVGPDTEYILTRGNLRLVVSPYGASLRGLSRLVGDTTEQTIITGYRGAKNKVGGQGDVLIPFPGRVGNGHYLFEGRELQMNCNDKDGPNAIHGFLRTLVWDTKEQSDEAVTFSTSFGVDDHPGYPFALRAEVTYALTEREMRCEFNIENVGPDSAPVAAGFHPYFTVGTETIDTAMLQVPFQSLLEFNTVLIPTGTVLPVADTPFDFRQANPIGDVQFNTCFLNPQRDPDGRLNIRLSDPATGRAITLSLGEAFDYVVLYSGDPLPETHRRRALAIEPMTCGSDAFNHPAWGLTVLHPTKEFRGWWQIEPGV